MNENKTRLTTRRFERWWRKAQGWFATQFASIHVDLTSVEEKVDEVQRAVKLTIAQYEALSSYDDNTVYYVTDNAGTKVITRYIGDTPIAVLSGSVMGESAYGNTVLL